MDRDKLTKVLRWVLALAVFAFFMYWSFFLGSFVGWGFTPRGPHRITENWYKLLLSSIVGVIAVASGRGVLRLRILSPWLLLGLLPATYWVLIESGLLY